MEGDWPTTLAPGGHVGPFRILGVLGRGGMSTVYRAQDDRLERTVALKVLSPALLYDATVAKRFEQEARVVARLEHPNIVPIYASGIDDGVPWMSMRLLAGGNLDDLLEHGIPDPRDVVHTLRSVAEALDYAHACGVVHRDIKPSNILRDAPGRVYLGDFGLAHIFESERGVTRTGTLLGTPHYMAPEQALGKPVDHRCDIYSLGIVAYEMFCGVRPFTGDAPMAVLLKHLQEPLLFDGGVSPLIVDAIQKAVAKTPAERWPTAGAFISALEVAVGTQSPEHTLVPENANQVSRPVTRTSAAAFVGALLVAAGIVWWMSRAPVPRDEPGAIESAQQQSTSPEVVREMPTVLTPEATNRDEPAPTVVRPRPRTEIVRGDQPTARQAPADTPPLDGRSLGTVAAPTATVRADIPTSQDPVAAPPDVVRTDVLAPPVRTREVSPEYPAAARAAQLEGDVLLEAVVGTDGKVRDVTVLRSVHPLLDAAAKTAVLHYEYVPGHRNGTPELARVRLTVSFKLR